MKSSVNSKSGRPTSQGKKKLDATTQIDRQVVQLEKHHKSTSIRKSLQLIGDQRVVPDPMLKKSKPRPDFNIDFADLNSDEHPVAIDDYETLPDVSELVESVTNVPLTPARPRKGEGTPDTNYSDPEMDDLLQNVDLDELESNGYASIHGTQEGDLRTQSTRLCNDEETVATTDSHNDSQVSNISKKRTLYSPQPTSANKKIKADFYNFNTAVSVTESNCPSDTSPLFLQHSSSQECDKARNSKDNGSQQTAACTRNSANNDRADDDGCFVLDESLFIAPTRNLIPERIGDVSNDICVSKTSNNSLIFQGTGLLRDLDKTASTETIPASNMPLPNGGPSTIAPVTDDDYLAEFEAWLYSGAVEFVD